MRALLDTNALLWWLDNSPNLSNPARAAIGDAASEIFVSTATFWEISIKRSLGRLDFPIDRTAEILEDSGFTALAINVAHAVAAGALPPIHQDPFDRMLIAQARCEGLTIITSDRKMQLYDVTVIDAGI